MSMYPKVASWPHVTSLSYVVCLMCFAKFFESEMQTYINVTFRVITSSAFIMSSLMRVACVSQSSCIRDADMYLYIYIYIYVYFLEYPLAERPGQPLARSTTFFCI